MKRERWFTIGTTFSLGVILKLFVQFKGCSCNLWSRISFIRKLLGKKPNTHPYKEKEKEKEKEKGKENHQVVSKWCSLWYSFWETKTLKKDRILVFGIGFIASIYSLSKK